MGFTEDEFYRTPMKKSDKDWIEEYNKKGDYPIAPVRDSIHTNWTPPNQPDIPRRHRPRESEFELIAGQYYSDLLRVLVQKQKDYGPLNISLAPGGAINGLLVRMNDKMQRLINLTYKSDETPSNEAIRDSYADLANYCVIAMMVLDNVWEGIPND